MQELTCACTISEEMRQEILGIIASHPEPEGRVNAIFADLMRRYRYIPEESIFIIARELKVPPLTLYQVAAFYRGFTLVPRGLHTVAVCTGTVCHVKGSARILKELEDHFKVKTGGTTEDGYLTLLGVNCLGCCSLAPAMMIDETTYGNLTPQMAIDIVEDMKKGEREE